MTTGARRARSVAIRIAELDGAETPRETEKPIGRDRGFLWRLNSYWRYEETGPRRHHRVRVDQPQPVDPVGGQMDGRSPHRPRSP